MKVGDLVKLKMLKRYENEDHIAVIIKKYQNPIGISKFRIAWTICNTIGDYSVEDAERLFEVISENKNE